MSSTYLSAGTVGALCCVKLMPQGLRELMSSWCESLPEPSKVCSATPKRSNMFASSGHVSGIGEVIFPEASFSRDAKESARY